MISRKATIALLVVCLLGGFLAGGLAFGGSGTFGDRPTDPLNAAEDAATAEAIREALRLEESRSTTTAPPLEDLEVARDGVAAAVKALEEAGKKDLQAELARIETAAEVEAADARARLREFRGQVVAYWEAHFEASWAHHRLPGDSGAALKGEPLGPLIPLEVGLAAFSARSMLEEIDFALSQVASNVETARNGAEHAARDVADERLNEVTDRFYVCMAVDEASGPSAEGVTECGKLLELGPPEWPPHDWACVHRDVLAVLSMRPDDYAPFDPGALEAKIGRIFACQGLELG